MVLFQKEKTGVKVKHKLIVKRVLILLAVVLGIGFAGFIALLWRECARYNRPQPPVHPAQESMERVRLAVIVYKMRYDRLPDSLAELSKPADKDSRPLLKEAHLLDPWGRPFGYEHDGENYVIWSSGCDKEVGTADDIFDGYPKSYVESWKTRHAQAVAEAETNRVQEATSETVETAQPSVGVEKTQASRVPVTTRQHTYESIEPTPTWKILLCVGAIVVGVMAVWRCFRKGKQESGVKAAIRFILECIAVFLAIIVLCVVTICAYSLWEDMRYPRGPGIPRIRLQISEIEKAVEIYAMIHQGKLPASLDDLIQGTEDNPPLLKKEAIIDPWGEPFEYKRTGRNFTIRSSGPDRQMGTEDDVTN